MTLRPALTRTALVLAAFGIGAQIVQGAMAAQDERLVRRGKELAETSCADCHTQGGRTRSDRPSPDFAAIGAMPSTTRLSLRVFLKSPHPNMPDLILNDDEIDAVSAYILDLGGK